MNDESAGQGAFQKCWQTEKMEAEDFGQQKRKEPKINYGRIAWKDVS
jgi:hypothetical protein